MVYGEIPTSNAWYKYPAVLQGSPFNRFCRKNKTCSFKPYHMLATGITYQPKDTLATILLLLGFCFARDVHSLRPSTSYGRVKIDSVCNWTLMMERSLREIGLPSNLLRAWNATRVREWFARSPLPYPWRLKIVYFNLSIVVPMSKRPSSSHKIHSCCAIVGWASQLNLRMKSKHGAPEDYSLGIKWVLHKSQHLV